MSQLNNDSPELFDPSKQLSFVNYVQIFASLSLNYLKQTADKLIILAIIYSVISLLAYFLYLIIKVYVKDDQKVFSKRVLIVTAHPDDECMFFGPTIVNLQAKDIPVHLLCVSPGDSFPNKRNIRTAELWKSCAALGLDERLIELKKYTLLPDGPENEWCPKLIGKMILENIESLDIDTVITFDEMGVSEHPNHIALFNAMAYLTLNHLLPAGVCFYSLETVNRLRKYSFMLDFLTSFFLSKFCIISNLKQQYMVVKAMSCHKSQFVWYRKLYIILSRYVTINTLKTWTQDELKECVKYQDLVDGMKYKNKWYESLDDSLKKINSEHNLNTVPKIDDFDSESNAEDDADVSFVAKTPEINFTITKTQNHDPLTTNTQVDSSGYVRKRRSVEYPNKITPESSPRETSRESTTHQSILQGSPGPDPITLGADESIHNGEIFVRKSRFLIPKTYRSFYNSSSSETSDDKDDGEASSESKASLDKIGKSIEQVDTAGSSPEIGICPNGGDKKGVPDEKKSELKNLGDLAEENFNVENLIEKDYGYGDLSVGDAMSTVTLVSTSEDILSTTVDSLNYVDLNEDIDEKTNLSYELEDIDSVLDEIDDVLDEENKDNITEGEDLQDAGDNENHLFRSNGRVYLTSVTKVKAQIPKLSEAQKDTKELTCTQNFLNNTGLKSSVEKYNVLEEESVLDVKNAEHDHTEGAVTSTNKEQSTQILKCTNNVETDLGEPVESSNSSEHESTIEQTSDDVNNLNKRNRKRRKNKKKMDKDANVVREKSDDLLDRVDDKRSESMVDQSTRLDIKDGLVRADLGKFMDVDIVKESLSTFDSTVDANFDSVLMHSNKSNNNMRDKHIHVVKELNESANRSQGGSSGKEECRYQHDGSKEVADARSSYHLGENNQNVFNLVGTVDEDTNALLQTVSTN